jgi:hypothetical protein
MADTRTVKKLRRYGERSAKNKRNLEKWLDESIESMGKNDGAQVSSASSNGASFSYRPDGMTNDEWSNCIDEALQMIENGIKSTSVSYGQIY